MHNVYPSIPTLLLPFQYSSLHSNDSKWYLYHEMTHGIHLSPWYLYQMVTQNMWRTRVGKYVFSEEKKIFGTALDLVKCLKQVKWQKLLLPSTRNSELPSNILVTCFLSFSLTWFRPFSWNSLSHSHYLSSSPMTHTFSLSLSLFSLSLSLSRNAWLMVSLGRYLRPLSV